MISADLIDEEILQKVIKMGYDRNQLVEYLRNRIQNESTVAYYLLLDNRLRASNGYLGFELQETLESGFSIAHSYGATPPPIVRLPGHVDSHGSNFRPQIPVERKWALGLQSKAHPREIMIEVLKALQELCVCWKKIGHYNMKCKWFPQLPESIDDLTVHANQNSGDDSVIAENFDASGKTSIIVKFEVQLYKTREEKYLLDLQRLDGPQLLFLDLCAALLKQLRVN